MPARRGTAPWGGILPWFWLAGLLHWAWFLDFGRLNYAVLDWQMQRAYDAEWSQALRHATLPWTTASPVHDTVMFLGNPEVPLDPFILLTAWCPPAALFHPTIHPALLIASASPEFAPSSIGRAVIPVASLN